MSIRFTKMHGLGNDFMVIEAIHQSFTLSPKQIAQLSHRDTGVGFDQCLVLEPSQVAGIDFNYRIFNADGGEVGQCGNGARCIARFIQRHELSRKTSITIATSSSRMQLQIHEDDTVTVNMGKPKLQPKEIPMHAEKQQALYSIPISQSQSIQVHAVNVGNPHIVYLVSDISHTTVDSLGQVLSQHPFFPEEVNVGFMQIENPQQISLRVYERGCGETKACGSGAVAAVATGRLYHSLAEQVEVCLPGGELTVTWPDLGGDIFLRGPAHFVYEGVLD